MHRPSDIPRLLMIAQACYPPQAPEAAVNAKLVLAMRAAGWEVDVISRSNSGEVYPPSQSDPWAPVAQVTHSLYAEVSRSLPNTLRKIRGALRTGHVTHGLVWVDAAISLGMKLCRERHYDCILSRSSPYFGHLPALVIKRRTGLPWIANWNDPDPIEKYPPPYGQGPDARISPLTTRYFNAVSASADWHTFPSERLRRYCAGYLGNGVGEKSSVIPHVAIQRVGALPDRSAIMHFCHAGTVTAPRDPKPLLMGIKHFIDQHPDAAREVAFKFIGTVPKDMGEFSAKLGISQIVQILGTLGYEETQRTLESEDVFVIVEAPMAEGIFLPSKFVDAIQLGKPIFAVSPREGTLADVLNSRGGGIAVDCTRPDEIARGLAQLHLAWKSGQLSSYSSQQIESLYSEEFVLNEYRKLFKMLTNRTAARS